MLTIHADDGAYRSHLERLHEALGNLEPVMDAIGLRLESNIHNRFATRTDPNGEPWAPWKDSTRENYPFPGTKDAAKEGPGNARLLDRYGTMLASLGYDSGPTSVSIGFGQPYATYHEFGTKHMDRRGMLMADPEAGILGPDDETGVVDILTNWLDDLAN